MRAALPVVLLAEKDPFTVQRVSQALGGLVDITAVSSGSAALAEARAMHPDLLITAVLLPDFDGYQLCRQVRSEEMLAGVKIMVISVLNSPQIAYRAGADAFLAKPFDGKELRSLVGRLLAKDSVA